MTIYNIGDVVNGHVIQPNGQWGPVNATPVPSRPGGKYRDKFTSLDKLAKGMFIGMGAVLVLFLLLTISSGIGGGTPGSSRSTTSTSSTSVVDRLAAAAEVCGLTPGRGGLFLDGSGRYGNSGTLTTTQQSCVLGELEAPRYVIDMIERTRDVDGIKTAVWNGINAEWQYSPEMVLDIILTP